MKNGSNQFNNKTEIEFCAMCGAIDGDFWQTQPTRSVTLRLRLRYGDIAQSWILYDECNEGLVSLNRQRRRSRMGAASS